MRFGRRASGATVPLLLLLAGCGSHGSSGVKLDSTVAKLIAPNTVAIAYVALDQVKNSPLYRENQGLLNIPSLDEASRRLGLDPRRDLSAVTFAWNGEQGLAIVEGRFEKKKLEQKLAETGSGAGRNTFAVLRDGVAIGGTAASIHGAINREEEGHNDVPDQLVASLKWLPKADQIWVVSRGSLPFSELPTQSEYSSLLSNFAGYIKGTAIGVRVDSGLHLRGRVECISSAGAKRVNDALRGGIGLLRLSTKDNELELLKVYDAIKVRQDYQTVYLDADLSGGDASQLIKLAERLNANH